MNAERWHRLNRIFEAAAPRAAAERAAILERFCADDSELRSEADSLLAAHDAATGFIETPAFDAAPRCSNPGEGLLIPPGERLDHYTIIRLLGRGGMGVVYEAEQAHPRRRVALKVMRPDATSPELQQRFVREASVLARLSHPGIAQVFEAGVAATPAGFQPYFSMEIVPGEPITAYARSHNLDTRARLALFARVCDAVQHAHEKGTLHRDLKPSNILVTANDQPKILDFGVARVTDGDTLLATRQTRPGELIGTLAYMSPEQVRGSERELDTRSDIYALGVLLYELVVGRLPYDLNGRNVMEVGRVIVEQRPAPLRAARREFSHDLDTIVQKALEKEPSRRYASADALATDLRRYLDLRPILARPPSTAYLLRKFVARHRAASVLVIALAVGLLALAITNFWLAMRYADQRDAATQLASEERSARQSADEVVAFLELVFSTADPMAVADHEPSLHDVLQTAESRLAEIRDQPLVRARVIAALAKVYQSRAKFVRARELFQDALETRRTLLGPDHVDVAASLLDLSGCLSAAGLHPEAIAAAEEAVTIVERRYGRRHSATAAALSRLGAAQHAVRKLDAAQATLTQVLDILRAVNHGESRGEADALISLGVVLTDLGRPADALDPLRAGLALRERLLGDSPELCAALANLAGAVVQLDRAEAEALLARRVEVARRIYHENHPGVGLAIKELAYLVKDRDAPAATQLYRDAADTLRRSVGNDHPLVADALNDLGFVLNSRGDLAGAERAHAEALEIRRKHFGSRDGRVLLSINNLALSRWRLGRPDEAAALSAEIIDAWSEIYGPEHAMVGVAHQNRATYLVDMGDLDEAEAHLRTAEEIYRALDHVNRLGPLQSLAGIRLRQGRLDDSEALFREAAAVAMDHPKALPSQKAQTLANFGAFLVIAGASDEAEAVLSESLDLYAALLAPGDPEMVAPLVWLAELQLRRDGRVRPELLESLTAILPKLSPRDVNLGHILALQGMLAVETRRFTDAVAALREALCIHEEKWGALDWRTARTRARLGRALAAAADPAARETLEHAAPLLAGVLGPHHPDAAAVLAALADAK